MSNRVILSQGQFSTLHRIILAWPNGVIISRFDEDVNSLAVYGFVKQHADGWKPTEEGVSHVMPKRAVG